MMKKIFSLLITYFLLVSQCFATTGIPDSRIWDPIGFGGGGSYSMILSDNTTAGKLYLSSDVNDPWVSTDAAETWTQMPNAGWYNDFTAFMAQSPSDPLTLWAIGRDTYLSGGSVVKSKDGGETWAKMASLPGVTRGFQYISIDPSDDDHVFVASKGSVWETTNEGATWVERVVKPFSSRVSTQSNCTNAGGSWSASTSSCSIGLTFVYYDVDTNDLIIGSGSSNPGFGLTLGMVRYDLDTDTQSYIDLTGTNAKRNFWYETYLDGATKYFCTTAGQKIACSSDYSTWNYTANTYWDSTYWVQHFVVHKTSGGVLRFVADTAWSASAYIRLLQRSVDGGTTWSSATKTKASTSENPTNAFSTGGLNVFSLTEDNHDEDTIYMTNDWAAYVSTNGGANFYEKTKGAQDTVATDVDVAPNGTMFISMMDAGIAYKLKDSSTWVSVFPNATYTQSVWGGHTWRILCLGTLSDWNAGNGVVVATHTTYQSGKYYWTYVLRSTNNGASFTPILIVDKQLANGLWGNGYPRGLAMSADQNTMYLSVDGDNCKYNDSLPATCPSASNPTPSNWITGGIFISRDRGATWARSNGDPRITKLYATRRIFNALAVDPSVSSGNTVLFGAFGYQNSWRSKVAGSTDTENPETGWGYTGSTDWIRNMKFGSDNVPLLTGVVGSVPVVYRSIDTVYGQHNGAWGTWQKMIDLPNSGMAAGLEIDPVNPNRVFVSTVEGTDAKGNRKVYVTWDAQKGNAASWVDITGNLPLKGCNNLKIYYTDDDAGRIVCAAAGGGVLELDMASTTSLHPGKIVIGGSTIDE